MLTRDFPAFLLLCNHSLNIDYVSYRLSLMNHTTCICQPTQSLFVQLCTCVISPVCVWDVRSRAGHAWFAGGASLGYSARQICTSSTLMREKTHQSGCHLRTVNNNSTTDLPNKRNPAPTGRPNPLVDQNHMAVGFWTCAARVHQTNVGTARLSVCRRRRG